MMMQLCRFLSLMFSISLFVLSLASVPLHAQPLTKEYNAKEGSAQRPLAAEKSALAQNSQAPGAAKITSSKQIRDILEKLAINQGKGQFTQQKYFSFMSVPITSIGHFIVKDESALWQTEQPVFSALLLTPNAIYRRLSLDDDYQLLTDSAEFSAILSTIFTGKVNVDDWQLKRSEKDTCLELTPKSGQLKQLFKQVDLCLANGATESSKPQQQRQITLTDSKGDKTVITMLLSEDAFIVEDIDALKRSSKQAGTVNAR